MEKESKLVQERRKMLSREVFPITNGKGHTWSPQKRFLTLQPSGLTPFLVLEETWETLRSVISNVITKKDYSF